jgi:hypothetical protein
MCHTLYMTTTSPEFFANHTTEALNEIIARYTADAMNSEGWMRDHKMSVATAAWEQLVFRGIA